MTPAASGSREPTPATRLGQARLCQAVMGTAAFCPIAALGQPLPGAAPCSHSSLAEGCCARCYLRTSPPAKDLRRDRRDGNIPGYKGMLQFLHLHTHH